MVDNPPCTSIFGVSIYAGLIFSPSSTFLSEKKDNRGRENSQRKLKMGCSLSLSEGCKMAERVEEF